MKAFKILIFSVITLIFMSVSAKSGTDLFCEPSLIFPEMFILESTGCFSYLEASSKYSDRNELTAYLNSTGDSWHQNVFRYLYYLREEEYLSALMTFMYMVNTGTVPSSIESISGEFDNIITGGLKREQKNGSGGNILIPGGKTEQVSTEKLSDNFFSALSFIASYSRQIQSGMPESDEMMMIRSFFYVISNIQTGIDWQGDKYLNDLFNKFIYMKNNNLLESFTQVFFFNVRKEGAVPSFKDYLKLREIGMIKDIRIADNIETRQKGRETASFFIENINSLPDIEYAAGSADKAVQGADCIYLDERGVWIKDMADSDPKEYYFNESVKIVEQCPGVFSLPFSLKKDKIVIYDKSYWVTDIAIVMNYLVKGSFSHKESDALLKAAVTSSLLKSLEVPERTLLMDILSYTNETGNAEKVLRSLLVKQLPQNDSEKGVEPVTKAAEIISTILF
ncbi:MAG TPA: hypothetical protein PLZ43_02315 [bacterium]|nr:hypothetical protein [bacterium]